jgi:hypothetical protein
MKTTTAWKLTTTARWKPTTWKPGEVLTSGGYKSGGHESSGLNRKIKKTLRPLKNIRFKYVSGPRPRQKQQTVLPVVRRKKFGKLRC